MKVQGFLTAIVLSLVASVGSAQALQPGAPNSRVAEAPRGSLLDSRPQSSVGPQLAQAGEAGAFVVYFGFDKSELRPADAKVIDAVLAAAAEDPKLTVRVVAHTDSVGRLDYNQSLSELRANAVILALIQGGLDRSRIISQPVGETRLRVDTGDEVNEQENRVAVIDLL